MIVPNNPVSGETLKKNDVNLLIIENKSVAEFLQLVNELNEKEIKVQRFYINASLEGKRAFPRATSNAVVDFALGDYYSQNFMRNVSMGGVFIEGSIPQPVGYGITMIFIFPINKKPVKITGKVAWKDPHGFGVKFDRTVSRHMI